MQVRNPWPEAARPTCGRRHLRSNAEPSKMLGGHICHLDFQAFFCSYYWCMKEGAGMERGSAGPRRIAPGQLRRRRLFPVQKISPSLALRARKRGGQPGETGNRVWTTRNQSVDRRETGRAQCVNKTEPNRAHFRNKPETRPWTRQNQSVDSSVYGGR